MASIGSYSPGPRRMVLFRAGKLAHYLPLPVRTLDDDIQALGQWVKSTFARFMSGGDEIESSRACAGCWRMQRWHFQQRFQSLQDRAQGQTVSETERNGITLLQTFRAFMEEMMLQYPKQEPPIAQVALDATPVSGRRRQVLYVGDEEAVDEMGWQESDDDSVHVDTAMTLDEPVLMPSAGDVSSMGDEDDIDEDDVDEGVYIMTTSGHLYHYE